MKRLALLCLLCLACSSDTTTEPQATPDESDVYVDLMDHLGWTSDEAVYETLVIRDMTQAGGWGDEPWRITEYIRGHFPDLEESTIESYECRNMSSTRLLKRQFHELPVVLLGEEERAEIFSNPLDGWTEFYRRYPDSQGIATLSRVGFSDDGRQAFMYFGNSYGGLGGGGYVVMFERVGWRWKVEHMLMLWIS